MVKKRKPVIFIDDSNELSWAIELLEKEKIEYASYHIKKFEESCCGEVPTRRNAKMKEDIYFDE